MDGKALARGVTDAVADVAARFTQEHKRQPGLAVVLVGEDAASQVYVRSKGKMAAKCGFHSVTIRKSAELSQEELLATVDQLNADDNVDGILVQLPLPDHISADAVLNAIDPAKDVDGFHPVNAGRLASGDIDNPLIPCTPAGIMHMIRTVHGKDLSGLSAVVLGRSTIVGRPISHLLLAANATVTVAHSRTKDIAGLARSADILVAAVGRPQMVGADWVKPGATVIDVGINRIEDQNLGTSQLVGDVDFDAVQPVAGALTPVPGGVGPMTIAMLMANTLKAAEARARSSAR
ncbi:MAG: bifunctional methylenetetrahydrofolate dehydrogenase/methenyltetrahydrofolate cyclohydrolase FolD [Rhizobiales bacterium]|nr:bifunctional methylenetetrahydrofolate dehydrogenase/methenyltetrahydrofolate cyclohydrolase FolD [Hyphomicrobiales bacterium]MBO6699310.1 bifunctional methylenetetrahydrofolate dehydrogenase/methenyltetrahydrofolate cyclohydrolase FolD [Hyphomicrobiales bacterium]MBO6736848.1 bifunctional methylenetetrahydrofolate dehydrogenase/methenyltetrahydrofolate cyclohydrolase FolD [Hyphomicrobiales bacterium]MBO6912078.1 bifunctional methylenetetrahydrofolate dehydrogenase/methenyltetrahydrofolate cy